MPSETPSRPRLRWGLVVAGAVLGVLAGYQLGYSSTLPGFGSLGVAVWLGIIAATLLVTGVIGLVVAAFERSRAFGIAVLGAAGASIAAVVVTAVAVLVLDLGYHDPVVLRSSGTMSMQLADVDAFAPLDSGLAECSSGPDVIEVQGVFSPDLGEGPLGTFRARVDLPGPELGAGWVEVFIDAGDLAGDLPQIFWDGPAEFDTNPDRTSGTARFRDLQLTGDAGAATTFEAVLPAALSGSITWRCEGWRDPAATVQPEEPGVVTLVLPGEDLAVGTDAEVSCAFEEDGTVQSVLAIGGYRLQGWPLRVEIGLSGRHVPESDVQVMVVVESGKDPPPGLEFIPSWAGQGSLDALTEDERTGSASFTDLPTGVDPSIGDPPAGWPAGISGKIDWTCEPDR